MGRPVNVERRQERQQQFLAAFVETGILSQAAERSGIVATQHHRWVKDDPDYARRFSELKEETRDLATQNRRPHSRGYRVGGERGERRKASQDAFLVELAETGVIAEAARQTGTSTTTFHGWVKDDPDFAERAEAILAQTVEERERFTKEQLSKASRARWDDPERRADWSRRQRESWTPEKRAAVAERMRNVSPEARRRAAAKAWLAPERRNRQSEAMKLRWADADHRALMSERMNAPATVEKLRQASTAQWAAMSAEERRERMRRMRRAFKGGHRLTKIEADVMVALNDREIPYFVHKLVGDYVADLLVSSLKLIIECDGAFHHESRQEWDAARDAVLHDLGYRVLRLTQEQIKARDWTTLDQAIQELSATA